MVKEDRRVGKTRRALQEALITLILERGYETLRVQDVLDRADVGRTTFYAHFYDLRDLLDSEFEVLQREFEAHMADHSTETSIWDLSRLVFEHAGRYQALYKAVAGKDSGRMIQANLHQYLSTQISSRLKVAHWKADPPVALDMLEHHLASTLIALLSYWLDNGLTHSAEEMAEYYQALVSGRWMP